MLPFTHFTFGVIMLILAFFGSQLTAIFRKRVLFIRATKCLTTLMGWWGLATRNRLMCAILWLNYVEALCCACVRGIGSPSCLLTARVSAIGGSCSCTEIVVRVHARVYEWERKKAKCKGSAEPEVKSANTELLVECILWMARPNARSQIDWAPYSNSGEGDNIAAWHLRI